MLSIVNVSLIIMVVINRGIDNGTIDNGPKSARIDNLVMVFTSKIATYLYSTMLLISSNY